MCHSLSLVSYYELERHPRLLMQRDNLADPDAGSFTDLGIMPRTLHDSLPRCLSDS
ncbi:hypothetical protein [Halomonas icarae]|uniref:hypothetical protein n=1 Tax=Halomonas icarae TaxID=2691040 RepID=UPI0019299152|nr:hypothetical protein [Halomonas icarae]MDR5901549.1 hypothetical protein [Halomonas icarae]